MTNSSVLFKDKPAFLNRTYSLPKISALVFRFFFFSTSASGNTLFSSSSGARQRSLMTSGRSRMPFSHGSMGGRGVPGFTARWCRHWKTARVEKQIQGETEQLRVDLHSLGTWELSYATIVPVTQQNRRQGWHSLIVEYILGSSTWKSLWKSGLGMWWTLKMSFGFSSSPSSTSIMESMRLSTADNWASRETTWMQTNLQRWANRQCRGNQPVLGTKTGNLEYDMQKHGTCGGDLLVFKRRKWELSKVFHERQLDIHQTLLNMGDIFALFSPAHFTESCSLSRRARSDLIVLLNTRDSCSYLRVAALLVGITHNGHHLKLM